MTLLELFLEYGNPAETYSDEIVARFYDDVDDGAFFTEALGELNDEERKRLARLIYDPTSRSLSHQMIGKIVTDQLKGYVRLYLQKKHDELEGEIREQLIARARARHTEIEIDKAMDDTFKFEAGDAAGWIP